MDRGEDADKSDHVLARFKLNKLLAYKHKHTHTQSMAKRFHLLPQFRSPVLLLFDEKNMVHARSTTRSVLCLTAKTK